jgi:hypothetical protein
MGRPWTAEELEVLREAYAAPNNKELALPGLCERLGRTYAAVALKASRLGLASFSRPRKDKAECKVRVRKYVTDEERNRAQGERTRQRLRENGHPRGALDMKHTPETRAILSEKSKAAWANPKSRLNSPEESERRAANVYARVRSGAFRDLERRFSRAKSGRRADYARFLNLLLSRGEIVAWDYESKTFEFEAVKRGTRFYTPDFEVRFTDGRIEWHEVKGWMDDKSRVRLERMAKHFPGEKVVVIGADWFRQAYRGLAHVVSGWEFQKGADH